MTELERLFAVKQTENGDISYNTTGNHLLDLLFMSSYFEKNLKEVHIGNSELEQLFSMFIRDGRYGLGRRDLGRRLMYLSDVTPTNIVKAGRYDDLLFSGYYDYHLQFIVDECHLNNQLAKKWMPRLNSKNKDVAKYITKITGMTEKEYRKLIKCDTVENKLSRHRTKDIDFEQVPSLAMVKYFSRFATGEDTSERFSEYLENVKSGDAKLNISTTNVYDIYKNRYQIDADLFFDKLEKIKIDCIPILDTSGSMYDEDSIGKASSIAHYLTKCSTYAPNQLISFSSRPELMTIRGNNYNQELNSMYTGDCTNTDFRKVMEILKGLKEFPEYLIVLSDMEFDEGSYQSKEQLQTLWKDNSCNTRLVWWNFNSRNKTVPELDENGNIYISGYNPMLLKYLESGFNGEQFLSKLLNEYKNKICYTIPISD